MKSPLPQNEAERLKALQAYAILDTPPDAAFDDMVELASLICDTPMALVTLVDEDRQWFIAKIGVTLTETPRELAFCAHTILQKDVMVVLDATADPRFAENPLVTSAPGLRFYAGAPLITPAGHAVGSLAVLDTQPRREFGEDQRKALQALSRQVIAQLELRQRVLAQHRVVAAGARQLETVERRHRAILDAALDAIITIDASGAIVEFNPAAQRIFGYTSDEVLGRSMSEVIVPPLQREHHERGMAAFLKQGHAATLARVMEVAARRRDGSEFPAEVSILRIGEGEPVFFTGFVRDLTSRKREEDALRAQAEDYRRHEIVLSQLARSKQLYDENLAVALGHIAKTVAKALGTQRVSVWRFTDDRSGIKCVELFDAASGQHSSGSELKAAAYPAYFAALETHDVIVASDAHADPRTREFTENYLRPLGITAMLDAHIHLSGRIDGVLCHEHVGTTREWKPEESTFAVAVANLVSLVIEIWQRKQISARLRQSEERFRAFMQNSPAVAWFKDAEGRMLYVNPPFERVFNRTLTQVIGKTDHELWPEPVARQLREHDLQTLSRNAPLETYEDVPAADGVLRHWLTFKFPLTDADGSRLVGGMAVDMTARQQAEREVKRQAAFAHFNPNPVLELSAGGDVTYANAAAEEMARSLGHTLPRQMLPAETAAIVRECLASNQPRLRLETLTRPRVISWSFFPIASERVVHCYAGDISERKRLEDQVRQTQKMDAIGQLSAGVAHDFNNLLQVIKGQLGLLELTGGLPASAGESLEQISTAADRAANLTRQLLLFSRQQFMQPRILDLSDAAVEMAKMLTRMIGEQVTLEVKRAAERLPIHADPGMIDQILLNLVVNGRDAMPRGGRLVIATERCEVDAEAARSNVEARPGVFARVSVSDTGTGIAPEVLPRLFEPFFTTKEVGQGTGLGLATVYGIVQQHRGWIQVTTELGRGSTFHVYLPLSSDAESPSRVTPASALRASGTETILVVEDEADVRLLIEAVLLQNGYRVRSAETGPHALEVWREHREDVCLMLTDMVMPGGLTGKDLSEKFRREKSTLRVIYMSGYSPELANAGFRLQEGANFLAKPFEVQQLLRAVRSSLDGRGTHSPFPSSHH